ncbi:MAG: polysaccharide biosynthesis/export family protein [Aureliella sp.]
MMTTISTRSLVCLTTLILTLSVSCEARAQSQEQIVPPMANSMPMQGVTPGQINRCGYCATNPPPQPQVAAGRCQYCGVAVDCADNCGGDRQSWRDLHSYNFGPLAHGEWLGPVRVPSAVDNRLRPGDQVRFQYILSREVNRDSYRLQVGDRLALSSITDETLRVGDVNQGTGGTTIQPSGKIIVPLIGEQPAAGLTIMQLRSNLNIAYSEKIKNPAIDVIPLQTNTRLQDIRDAVDARGGQGGQSTLARVQPDGTVVLPRLGQVCVLGMTVSEVKREVNLRYREIVAGLEVEPQIEQLADHFVFVYGQVAQPGRFQLQGPTSVTQAIALAQGDILGANTRSVVIFRRAEDWRLVATKLDLRGGHLGKVPTPADEIWLRDGDLVIVPKSPTQRINDVIQQVFTDGIYQVLPFAQIGAGFDVGAGVVGQ